MSAQATKNALVTGAGSGIGLAFVELLLAKGYNCLIADLKLGPEATAIVEKTKESSPRAIFVETDVTSWKDLDELFEVVEKEYGEAGLDVVCPNAGVFEPPFSNFWKPPGSPESVDDPRGDRYKTIDINVTHPIRLAQLAVQHWMRRDTENRRRHLMFVSSILGSSPLFPTPIYVATKHAMIGLTRSLAPLDKLNIRVTCIAPGVTKTPLWTDHPEKMGFTKDGGNWVLAEEIGQVMMILVEGEKIGVNFLDRTKEEKERGVVRDGEKVIDIKSGVIVEVTRTLREVLLRGDPGPKEDVTEGTIDYNKCCEETYEALAAMKIK